MNFFLLFLDINKLLNKERHVVELMVKETQFLLESLRGESEATLLMDSVLSSKISNFEYLVQLDQDFSVVDDNGWNIVHFIVFASKDESEEMFRMFEKTKPDFAILINQFDNTGHAPIHYAAGYNNHTAIKTLFENGADMNLRSQKDNELPEEQKGCDEETIRLMQHYRQM